MRGAFGRLIAPGVALAVLATGSLTACSTAPGSRLDLVRAGCPAEVRVLADSSPRSELGALYALLGDDRRVDVETRSVSASLVADGTPTGVRLTIVSNDEFGGIRTNERLYDAEEGFLLATVDADIALVDADRFPTVGIFAPLERDPQGILWDPETYPAARTIAAIGVSIAVNGVPVPVRSAPDNLAFDFLVGSGLLADGQPLPVHDGTFDAFVEAEGLVAQQGEITTDPRLLQRLEDWGRLVRFELLDEAGYPRYASLLSARPDDVTRYADCFAALVPLLQQATVDFVADPDDTAALIGQLAQRFGYSDYDDRAALRAADILRERRLMGNGANETVGDVDGGRMQLLFDVAIPALRDAGREIPDDVTPGDIATNAFIDPGIGL